MNRKEGFRVLMVPIEQSSVSLTINQFVKLLSLLTVDFGIISRISESTNIHRATT